MAVSSVCVCVSLSVCLSVCLSVTMIIGLLCNIFALYWLDCEENTPEVYITVIFQISLDFLIIIMNTCIFDSFARYVCMCVFMSSKTIADVCSYVDWRKILGEFKCLDQGHYLTL